MSIRVHKYIGYGLTNLRTTSRGGPTRPRDPRWDYEKFRAAWLDAEHDHHPVEHFRDWCRANEDRVKELAVAEGWREHYAWLLTEGLDDRVKRKDAYRWSAQAAATWEHEGGMKNVLLFASPEYAHDWTRYDNIVDYYEEVTPKDGPRHRATRLTGRSGIHPFDGFVKRFRPPTPEVATALSAMSRELRAMSHIAGAACEADGADVTRLPGNAVNDLVRGASWARAPQSVREHFRDDWRPLVPVGVLAVIEYLGCFPDAFGPGGVVDSLRPMVYVYWS